MTINDIHQLLLKGERITLECKEAKNAVPKSIWESYSAFANTVGGTILLGIKENTKEKNPAKRFTITGVEDSNTAALKSFSVISSKFAIIFLSF